MGRQQALHNHAANTHGRLARHSAGVLLCRVHFQHAVGAATVDNANATGTRGGWPSVRFKRPAESLWAPVCTGRACQLPPAAANTRDARPRRVDKMMHLWVFHAAALFR